MQVDAADVAPFTAAASAFVQSQCKAGGSSPTHTSTMESPFDAHGPLDSSARLLKGECYVSVVDDYGYDLGDSR